MRVLTPNSLAEALDLMAGSPTPLPVAGGTDLLVSWHHKPKTDMTLLDLSRLNGPLRQLTLTPAFLEIGALATYWDVLCAPEVCAAFPLLADAARQVGAIQIQMRGTWAGNIANSSPAADGVPVLMAYNAIVVLQSKSGRREVALDAYWTGYKQTVKKPNELIVSMRLPIRKRSVEWFEKVGARSAQTITKVGAAVVHDEKGWRVVANSVAPFVCRCRQMESALARGQKFANPDEVRAVIRQDIKPIDDMRSNATYREVVLSRLLFHRLVCN